jgi:hypothetical protein
LDQREALLRRWSTDVAFCAGRLHGVVVSVRSSTTTTTTRTPEPREFRELIEPLEFASGERLRGKRRRECLAAFLESPACFRQIVDEALVGGRRPLGLLVHKVREDQHLDDLPPLAEIDEARLASESGRRNGHRPPCPSCEVGGGQHAADCPTLEEATT